MQLVSGNLKYMYANPFLWATLYTPYLNVMRKALQQRSFLDVLCYLPHMITIIFTIYELFSIFGLVNLRTSEPLTFSDL